MAPDWRGTSGTSLGSSLPPRPAEGGQDSGKAPTPNEVPVHVHPGFRLLSSLPAFKVLRLSVPLSRHPKIRSQCKLAVPRDIKSVPRCSPAYNYIEHFPTQSASTQSSG